MTDDDRDYHLGRARAELDLAYRAERKDVAAAHMRLSSLHMQRIAQEDAGEPRSAIPLNGH
jgi:hypothetical protein